MTLHANQRVCSGYRMDATYWSTDCVSLYKLQLVGLRASQLQHAHLLFSRSSDTVEAGVGALRTWRWMCWSRICRVLQSLQ
jgi:hypothetical protein